MSVIGPVQSHVSCKWSQQRTSNNAKVAINC